MFNLRRENDVLKYQNKLRTSDNNNNNIHSYIEYNNIYSSQAVYAKTLYVIIHKCKKWCIWHLCAQCIVRLIARRSLIQYTLIELVGKSASRSRFIVSTSRRLRFARQSAQCKMQSEGRFLRNLLNICRCLISNFRISISELISTIELTKLDFLVSRRSIKLLEIELENWIFYSIK